jgi:putative holliday junction resolvase
MKILAIDYGLKRIGFAIGNSLIKTATPLEPLARKNSKQAVAYIKQLIIEYDISRIALGYPLNMDGTKSTMSEQVEHFSRRLQKALGPDMDIDLIDERLSSFEADETLKDLHPNYKKRKKVIDSMSAVIILNRCMDMT